MEKRGQVGIEYMILIGFVTLTVLSIFIFAVFYSNQIKDRMKINSIQNFADQLIQSSESVFFAGEPSKTTISLYLPEGVQKITVNEYSIVIVARLASGDNILFFPSKVPLSGSISSTGGTKKLSLEAHEDYLLIS